MKKIFGKFILGLSNVLNKIFAIITKGLFLGINFLKKLSVYIIFLVVGLLLIFGFFAIPILLILITNPTFWIIVFVFFILPFLGKKFISFLEYSNYILCEYLKDYGNYLIGNTDVFRRFNEYSKMFYKKQEKERRERQRKEEQEWEKKFSDFFTFGQGGYYQNYNSQDYYQNYNSNSYNSYTNPYMDFKKKFEKCCDILEFTSYDVDFYKVKLQYRKLAKKYHPDLNPDKDTTAKFQEINSAFEFLTEENIKRYKEIINR